MSTNTALNQIKARVEGHSATPWQVKPYLYGSDERVRVTSPDDGPDFNTAEDVLPADAELIAAAPKMLAALEAVEAKHSLRFYDKWGRDHAEPQGLGGWCATCQRFDGYYCPTIAAIEEALR